MEAASVVIAVGPGITSCKIGDIVAYAGFPVSAYAEEQILPASIDPIVAAAVIFKGLTDEVLVRRCFKTEPGHTILYHAAAGGVGSLVCQWANALGATVIGIVSTKAKAVQAKEDGCHHVIIYKEESLVDRVKEITSGKGVDVAYESIGKDTFLGSIECVKPRGYLVTFGMPPGKPDPLDYFQITKKSLFFTAPAFEIYTETQELLAASEEFSTIEKGIVNVRVNHKYPLSQAAQAHTDMENQKTTGSIVLIPDN
ncbi:putative alcohol dehydrogenase superfamily protein [Tanacetum coccineum]